MSTSRNCAHTWFQISLEMDMRLSQRFQLHQWTVGVKSMCALSSPVSCQALRVIQCHLLCNEGPVPLDGYQVLCCPLCPLHLFYVLCNVSCIRYVYGSLSWCQCHCFFHFSHIKGFCVCVSERDGEFSLIRIQRLNIMCVIFCISKAPRGTCVIHDIEQYTVNKIDLKAIFTGKKSSI